MKFITINVKYYSEISEPLAATNGIQTRMSYVSNNSTQNHFPMSQTPMSNTQDQWKHYPKDSNIKLMIGYEIKQNFDSFANTKRYGIETNLEKLFYFQMYVVHDNNKILKKIELDESKLKNIDSWLLITVKEPSISIKYLEEESNCFQTMLNINSNASGTKLINKFQITCSISDIQQILNFYQLFNIHWKGGSHRNSLSILPNQANPNAKINFSMGHLKYGTSEENPKQKVHNNDTQYNNIINDSMFNECTLINPINNNRQRNLNEVTDLNNITPLCTQNRININELKSSSTNGITNRNSHGDKHHHATTILNNNAKESTNLVPTALSNFRVFDVENKVTGETESDIEKNRDKGGTGHTLINNVISKNDAAQSSVTLKRHLPSLLLGEVNHSTRHSNSDISTSEQIRDASFVAPLQNDDVKNQWEEHHKKKKLLAPAVSSNDTSRHAGLDDSICKGNDSQEKPKNNNASGKNTEKENDIIPMSTDKIQAMDKAHDNNKGKKADNYKAKSAFRISKRTIKAKLRDPHFNKWVDKIEMEILKLLDK